MNRKVIYCVLAMLCIAALSITSCTAAKTVTQTVANTTVTQWTASLTETRTVTGQPITLTLPGNVTTIIPPTVTVLDPTTITAPAITTTVINTSVVTLPPVTTTVTTTITPTTTAPVLTAAEAVEIAISQLGGSPVIVVPGGTSFECILALTYDNTVNRQFTNVKFAISFMIQGVTITSPLSDIALASYGGTPLWYPANATLPYLFQTYDGVTIAANASGYILLTFSIQYTDVGVAGGQILPIVSIF